MLNINIIASFKYVDLNYFLIIIMYLVVNFL